MIELLLLFLSLWGAIYKVYEAPFIDSRTVTHNNLHRVKHKCCSISGDDNMLGEQSYKYLTVDEMKSLGDDSMPIDVTHDEKQQQAAMQKVRIIKPLILYIMCYCKII